MDRFFTQEIHLFASPALAGEVPNEVRRRGSCFIFLVVSHANTAPKTPSVCCAATSPASAGEAKRWISCVKKRAVRHDLVFVFIIAVAFGAEGFGFGEETELGEEAEDGDDDPDSSVGDGGLFEETGWVSFGAEECSGC